MADRQAAGAYTPNRKPRRGRGGATTPRGSPRGRGEPPLSPPVDSPISSSSSSNLSQPSPVTPSPSSVSSPVKNVSSPVDPPPPRPSTVPRSLSREDSQPGIVKPQSQQDLETPVVSASRTPTQVSKPRAMDSPQVDKGLTSAASIEEFSTPTSASDEKVSSTSDRSLDLETPKKTDEPKEAAAVTKPAEPEKAKKSKNAKSESVSSTSANDKNEKDEGPGIPDKPPRKSSIPEKEQPKTAKVFQPKVTEAPKDDGRPLTVEIETASNVKPGASEVDPPSSSVADRDRKTSERAGISPGGAFAYGLGGPVGKPAYGVSTEAPKDDDPWSGHPLKARRPSLREIKAVAKGFTSRQWTTLIIFGLADLFSAMVVSLQAPFYPPEAERKGATATQYGFVFGVYELVVLLTSPLYGKYINKIGPKILFNIGITTSSLACVAFGMLDRVDDPTLFIGLSFVLRIIEAAGAAAFVTSTFTIIAYEFPESVATTFASLETFFGLGLIIGPTVGGALFQVGGFSLPFAVTGVCLFILAIASAFVMPKIETIIDEHGNTTEGYGIFSILKIPSIFVAATSIMMAASTLGFLSATLEPHLRQFTLSPLQTGLMFIISGGVYAMSAPAFGWICDKFQRPLYITLIGACLLITSFILIGPLPFIPMIPLLWVISVGLVIHGFGLAASFVAGFISALRESMANGFPDNLSTYGVVSGLWTSSLSLGAFVGPSVGGALLDNFGFQDASYFPFGGEIILIFILIPFLINRRNAKAAADSEAAPLLQSGSEERRVEIPTTSGYGATGTGESVA